jgi:undecaprenyl-diphosphatase
MSFREKFIEFDHRSMAWMALRRISFITPLFRILTWSGTAKAWLTAALIMNFVSFPFIENQTLFLRGMLAALLAWGLSHFAKMLVRRRRPSQILIDYQAASHHPLDESMPSGHAATSMAFFFGLVVLEHPWATGVGIWALGVSLSRFYLGVHFPSDILAGSFLGFLCALLAKSLLF